MPVWWPGHRPSNLSPPTSFLIPRGRLFVTNLKDLSLSWDCSIAHGSCSKMGLKVGHRYLLRIFLFLGRYLSAQFIFLLNENYWFWWLLFRLDWSTSHLFCKKLCQNVFPICTPSTPNQCRTEQRGKEVNIARRVSGGKRVRAGLNPGSLDS